MVSIQLVDRVRSQNCFAWVHGSRIWPLNREIEFIPHILFISLSGDLWMMPHECLTPVLGQHSVIASVAYVYFFPESDRESLSWLPRHVTQSTFPSWLGLSVQAVCTQTMLISSWAAHPLLLSEVSWYFIAEWTRLDSLERKAQLFLLHLYHMLWNSCPGDIQEGVNSGLQWEHWWRAFALSAARQACSCYLHASIHLQTQSYHAQKIRFMWGREVGKTNYGSNSQLLKCTIQHEDSLADQGMQFIWTNGLAKTYIAEGNFEVWVCLRMGVLKARGHKAVSCKADTCWSFCKVFHVGDESRIKQIHLYIYEYPNVSRLHGDCNILPETSSGGFKEELARPK